MITIYYRVFSQHYLTLHTSKYTTFIEWNATVFIAMHILHTTTVTPGGRTYIATNVN